MAGLNNKPIIISHNSLFTIELVTHDILHVRFKTQRKLTSTFLRFQEYYESPTFQNKVFSLSEFKKWYTKNSPLGKTTGKFTYYTDWFGFNVPSYVFTPFFEGKFNPLTINEKKLLQALQSRKGEKFYVIGTFGSAPDTLEHEIAHGLFYTNPIYKKKVLAIIDSIPLAAKKPLIAYFKRSEGYHDSVIIDEIHAYLLSEVEFLEMRGVPMQPLVPYHKKLLKVYRAYC